MRAPTKGFWPIIPLPGGLPILTHSRQKVPLDPPGTYIKVSNTSA